MTGVEASSSADGTGRLPDSAELTALLRLGRAAREAGSLRELGFLLVNETHALVPYRQAALWTPTDGVHTLSGVLLPEANAPYVQWLRQAGEHLAQQPAVAARPFTAAALPQPLASAWQEWWPSHALWLPLGSTTGDGALVLVREEPWSPQDRALLGEWADIGGHAWAAMQRRSRQGWRAGWSGWRAKVAGAAAGRPVWQRPAWIAGAAALMALALPVRMTVLAPGELVPSHPIVVRSPLDGVVDTFHVRPNQAVRAGDALLGFDEAVIASKLQVAEQTLDTAATEYRQVAQQALLDPKARPQLAQLTGKVEEKRTEVDYLREQLQRARVVAPGAGVVLVDEPSEWIGRPVTVGERILRIAVPGDVEVEAWLPLADGVPLAPGSRVRLYLNASPLDPVGARVTTMAHEAVQRPDGTYAYRVRATLDEPTVHRVGLKGTAKLDGERVALGYWMLRRPLAWLRTTLGV